LVVFEARKKASMKEGHQSDKIDAGRLVELLRFCHLHRSITINTAYEA
jgi:hypothetical protein